MSQPTDANVVTSQPMGRDSTLQDGDINSAESNNVTTTEPRFSQFQPMMHEVNEEEEQKKRAEELARANTASWCCISCDEGVDCALDCVDCCADSGDADNADCCVDCCGGSGDTGNATGGDCCVDCCGGSGDTGNGGDVDWDCCGGSGDCGDCDCDCSD